MERRFLSHSQGIVQEARIPDYYSTCIELSDNLSTGIQMMFRQPIIALILLAVLPSCGANKELEQLNSDDSDRITILSILPKSGTGEIVSALFVTHHQNGKLALTGFYDRMNAEITASDFVYVDSLEQLNF